MNGRSDSFFAVDGSGRGYTVVMSPLFISRPKLDDNQGARFGIPSLMLSTGEIVKYLSHGEYEVLGPRLRLHSIDSDAP